ncbi:HAD family hydrolase [Metabacillus sediminilitoris]|jgi:HAD superfamily hydrolase (TIGR01509 family)|uniref:HAD family hydrolase n=1 Tax=Metabacillus sediminilitoris TaxID=2567941 RepID=A0A4V3WFF0_9BACI|nr:HAD family hydrolase [Metabacillus sediminilitoris]QGQ44425.1 HAD-IA family hydrolase [Metabacillus sediminilitoris]THF80048.1 HAD family hydrolase [Metabacillus sediminilitoris]
MIKAIIFDFDGLILDTETHEYEVLNEIFKEHQSELPLEVWGKLIGTITSFNPFSYLEEQTKKTFNHDELKKLQKERFSQRIMQEHARPGVIDYLDAAKSLGLKIGLASSSNYEWVSSHLKRLQLLDRFECIRTSDHVEHVKPDPALYVETAKCLGVNPEECIAFEDSANGALAAKRAGMKCVTVPNTVTKGLEFCEVDHSLESMAHMELKQLISFLNEQ